MNTIQINGTEYLSAREIEAHYGLTRKKCWQELQKLNLGYVAIAMLRFYPLAPVTAHFDKLK